MPTNRPDTYRHNNDTEPFVLPFDYQVGAIVSTPSDLLTIEPKKINQGGLVYVFSNGLTYQLVDKNNIENLTNGWRVFGEKEEAPFGLEGQVYKLAKNNSNLVAIENTLYIGNYVTLQEELDSLLENPNTVITFEEVFADWFRFSLGRDLSGDRTKVPSIPDETQSWQYNTSLDQVESLINSRTYTGFVSKTPLLSYTLNARLSSNSVDNDFIGIVIAFVEDQNDLVPNNAFGLDSLLYPNINTTDEFIPNQHTLSLIRSKRSVDEAYFLVYDFQKLSSKVIQNGSSLVPEENSPWQGTYVDIRVERNNDIIKVGTLNFSNLTQNLTFENTEMVVDLNSDPDLLKFKGPTRYGFSAFSQPEATFQNINIEGSRLNEIFDLRNGDVYEADSSGNWAVNTERNGYNETLERSLLFNETLGTLVWYVNRFENKLISRQSIFTKHIPNATGDISLSLKFYKNYKIELSENTILSFTDFPDIGESISISMIITSLTGVETLTLPSGWNVNGSYDPSLRNKFRIEFSNYITSNIEVDCFITQ